MALTYTPIASQTLNSTSSLVTFSSIPSGYTDLRLIFYVQDSGEACYVRLNGDSGSNYSRTLIYGHSGGSATTRNSSMSNWPTGGAPSGSWFDASILDIGNYSNTSNYKNAIFRQNSMYGSFVAKHVLLWSSTSAISQIDIHATSSNSLKAGSMFSLYGIKAA